MAQHHTQTQIPGGSADPVRTFTHWPLIMLLWLAGLLAAAQFAKLTLTLDAVQRAYPDGWAPLTLSCVAVVGILFGSVSGFVVGRIGARRAILWGIGLSAVVALAQGVPMSFAAFIITRIVEGVGHLLLVVALPTMIAGLARPQDKSVVMGL